MLHRDGMRKSPRAHIPVCQMFVILFLNYSDTDKAIRVFIPSVIQIATRVVCRKHLEISQRAGAGDLPFYFYF